MHTVSFNSYVTPSLTIKQSEKPLSGYFIQWGNSYIIEENKKIPITVALVRSPEGALFLVNPVGLQFNILEQDAYYAKNYEHCN